MAAAEATPLSPGEPGRPAGRALLLPGPLCRFLGHCAGVPATQTRPATLCGPQPQPARPPQQSPRRRGPRLPALLEKDPAGWHCGSTDPSVCGSLASPSALCGSKKAKGGTRSLPSRPSPIACPGVLGSPRLYLRGSCCQEEGAWRGHPSNSRVWDPSPHPSGRPCPSPHWPTAILRGLLVRPTGRTWSEHSGHVGHGFPAGPGHRDLDLPSSAGTLTSLLLSSGPLGQVPGLRRPGPCPPPGISGAHS